MNTLARFMRKLRADNGERMIDMANKLDVSGAYLSRVENGLIHPSSKVLDGLRNQYCLSREQKLVLDEIEKRTHQMTYFNQLQLSYRQRVVITEIAKLVKNMSDEELTDLEVKIAEKIGG